MMNSKPSESLASSLQPVFAYVDAQRERFLQRLIEYLRMPSISAHGTGIAEVAEHIAGVLRGMGMETRLMPTAGWPVVFAQKRRRARRAHGAALRPLRCAAARPARRVALAAVRADHSQWPPLRARRGDNKGQHFAQLLALESLLAVNGTLPCNVKVLLEGEEEIGSPRMAEFVREHRAEILSDLVITSDGPVHESGRSQLVCGVRGVLSFELRARGANRDLHSGNWGGVAPNPIWTLVHLLASMKNERGEITIEGFYDAVLPQTPLEQAALARDAPGCRAHQARPGAAGVRSAAGARLLRAVVGVADVHRQRLPQRVWRPRLEDGAAARGRRQVRYPPGGGAAGRRYFCEGGCARAAAYAELEVVHQGAMEPSKTPLDSPFVEPLLRAITLAQGEAPLLVPALGGSLPDYVWTKILGVPAFVVPYANADEANHAPNENIEVERFFMGIKTGAAMLSFLGAMRPKAP